MNHLWCRPLGPGRRMRWGLLTAAVAIGVLAMHLAVHAETGHHRADTAGFVLVFADAANTMSVPSIDAGCCHLGGCGADHVVLHSCMGPVPARTVMTPSARVVIAAVGDCVHIASAVRIRRVRGSDPPRTVPSAEQLSVWRV
ncbi:hypothetical protein FOS14_22380 [Skermania sp. ID1734]|uniref:hypothetical protein n=1 Tax=Skermania sp. ID1734 TaxID=2597516 RepID=UPI00117CC6A1|nr:hypothetical protein [Skermania sp. ID1734]TSD93804.1 hypothetical protein FOS14_22380 [Skermania sp. ID1734]